MHGLNRRLEEFLRDQRRHKCAQDDDTDKNRVLILVNDPVLQAIQRGNSSEGQTRGHQQRGVARFLDLHVMQTGKRKHADDFGHHLQGEEHADHQKRGP